MPAYEINFDGIVGPTHNYSGLSYGNVASMINQQAESNPREAALQGLAKMFALSKMGIKQAVLPPQPRPHLPTLRALGFMGSDSQVIEKASKEAPEIFHSCCSSATMWTANAATVAPSADSSDARVHLTPANLSSKFHRSIEADVTARVLKDIFNDPACFEVHSPLPQGTYFADEGAANHTRFCSSYDKPGVQLFVYGRHAFHENAFTPTRFPARQSAEASLSIARRHLLDQNRVVYAQQNPQAIDAGVFHNDVISVGNQMFFFYHERAFVDTETVIINLKEKCRTFCQSDLVTLRVNDSEVSLQDAVSSYLFNSQIVTRPDGSMTLIAPQECQQIDSVRNFLNKISISKEYPIKEILFMNLRESMRNGGGPACLRLRVVLNDKELAAANQHVFLTEALYAKLVGWVKHYYRDHLKPGDLADPALLIETQEALQELSKIIRIPSISP